MYNERQAEEEYQEERRKLSAKLADELRQLAQDVYDCGHGNKDAAKRVGRHIDGYWHAIVIGSAGELAMILDMDDEPVGELLPENGDNPYRQEYAKRGLDADKADTKHL